MVKVPVIVRRDTEPVTTSASSPQFEHLRAASDAAQTAGPRPGLDGSGLEQVGRLATVHDASVTEMPSVVSIFLRPRGDVDGLCPNNPACRSGEGQVTERLAQGLRASAATSPPSPG